MQLEIGKRYKRRDGKVTGPLIQREIGPNDNGCYTFLCPNTSDSYHITGEYHIGKESPEDLMKEYTEPPPPREKVLAEGGTANNKQVGGDHYKSQEIQPWDFVISNKLGFLEGNAIKYIARHTKKNGAEDIKKAIHYLEKLLETLEKK